jgi:hypothetical protein
VPIPTISLLRRRIRACTTHKVHFALARFFHRERECSLQVSILILEEEESLMWPFGLAIFGGS